MDTIQTINGVYPDEFGGPEPQLPERMKLWFELCGQHPYLAVICNYPRSQPHQPRPLPSAEFAKLVGTLRDETQRAIIRDLLMDLLTPALLELLIEAKERGIL